MNYGLDIEIYRWQMKRRNVLQLTDKEQKDKFVSMYLILKCINNLQV